MHYANTNENNAQQVELSEERKRQIEEEIARYFWNRYFTKDPAIEAEDCLQEIRIALFLATETFDPNKGNYYTYVNAIAKNLMKNWAEKNQVKDRKTLVSLDEDYNEEDTKKTRLCEKIPGGSEINVDDIDNGTGPRILKTNSLTPHQKEIITSLYGLDGKPLKQGNTLAEEMNVSEAAVAKSRKKVLKKLRKENGKLREYTNYSHILLDTELPNKTERMLTIAEINNTIA